MALTGHTERMKMRSGANGRSISSYLHISDPWPMKGHTQANENSCVVAQRRRSSNGAKNPIFSGTREPRGTSNCCYEHEYQTLHNGAPLGGFSCGGVRWRPWSGVAPVLTFIRNPWWPALV